MTARNMSKLSHYVLHMRYLWFSQSPGIIDIIVLYNTHVPPDHFHHLVIFPLLAVPRSPNPFILSLLHTLGILC